HPLLVVIQFLPGLDVVRQRHLLGEPDVLGEPVPHLDVLLILHPVPVDRVDGVEEVTADDRVSCSHVCHRPRAAFSFSKTERFTREVSCAVVNLKACSSRSPPPRCPRAPAGGCGCSTTS